MLPAKHEKHFRANRVVLVVAVQQIDLRKRKGDDAGIPTTPGPTLSRQRVLAQTFRPAAWS